MKSRDITALEETLGHQFHRPELLVQALTHSSQARELESVQASSLGPRVGDNEQLEFLGDAILGLVTSEELFRHFPGFHEGELSKLRAHLVSERHLIRVAQELELGHYLRLGRGEEKSGGRGKTTLLVDALEAVLAAIYLDSGMELTRKFIVQRIVAPELKRMDLEGRAALPITDFKSALQETMQAKGCPQPAYVLVKETFTVEVHLRPSAAHADRELVGRATGSTKKRAEQDAARQALEQLAAEPVRSSRDKARG
jgi:ribonuclease-3